jgi:hypothetical protein
VETAGDLVGVLVELAAGVQHGQRQLDAGDPLRGVDVHREPAPVVDHGDRVVRVDGDVHAVGVTRECLVDRVVHHLVHQVVEAPRTGGADVHARPLANRLQALEDLDLPGRILLG